MTNIKLTSLSKKNLSNGNLYKFIDKNNENFRKFGEVYFSFIKQKSIKAWKLHKKATMNIVVPIGKVRFILFENKDNKFYDFKEIKIGQSNYKLLTIKPNTWYGFQGLSKNLNLIVNLTNLVHDDNEMIRKKITYFPYDWSRN